MCLRHPPQVKVLPARALSRFNAQFSAMANAVSCEGKGQRPFERSDCTAICAYSSTTQAVPHVQCSVGADCTDDKMNQEGVL